MTMILNDTLCKGCKRRVRFTTCEKGILRVWCKLDDGDVVWDYPRTDCPDFVQEGA